MKYAANPILPLDRFVPDVEAHVWSDGRIYLYGSMDIQGNMNYCSKEYHVYSSDNMIDWVDHGVSFSLNQVTWCKDAAALYAPDCAYRNGKYYLYYCIPDGRCGVAVSELPYGPFKDVGPIKYATMIDPAVMIDDDGQAYMYWGQFDGVRVAKLKESMTELDPDTITQPLSVAEHEFHEGSSVKKINGKYYYLFTDTHRHNKKATSLGYAISDYPTTGFRYGGIIIDNFGCDSNTWNNHGSMECFNGQWYIFYHRSTHGCEFSRHVCAEPITINEDGTINEVKMTSSGVADSLPADMILPACRACEMSGSIRIEGNSTCSHGLILGHIKPNDTALFRYLSFNGENIFTARLISKGEMRLEIYIEDWYCASLTPQTNDSFAECTVEIPPITGKHILQLKFFGDFSDGALSEFVFKKNG